MRYISDIKYLIICYIKKNQIIFPQVLVLESKSDTQTYHHHSANPHYLCPNKTYGFYHSLLLVSRICAFLPCISLPILILELREHRVVENSEFNKKFSYALVKSLTSIVLCIPKPQRSFLPNSWPRLFNLWMTGQYSTLWSQSYHACGKHTQGFLRSKDYWISYKTCTWHKIWPRAGDLRVNSITFIGRCEQLGGPVLS